MSIKLIIDNIEIFYDIGKNEHNNHEIIKSALPDDMWFHFNDLPSSHVIAHISNYNLNKKQMMKILKTGIHLLKQKMHCNEKIDCMIALIKDVRCLKTPGMVSVSKYKIVTY